MHIHRILCPTTLLAALLVLSSLAVALAGGSSTSEARWWTRWRVGNMRYCGGKPDQVTFDGAKSVVSVAKGRHCTLAHTIRYTDLARDRFVLTMGKVSPGLRWEVRVSNATGARKWRTLMKGAGGGTHRALFSSLGLPRWLSADLDMIISSDKPGTVEIIGWAIQSTGTDPSAAQHAVAYRQLSEANPLERGLVPHWNVNTGTFVCAFNATHPEHYNHWLEDEGEALWSLGNYPDMMKLYGKGLRDFIVKHCKLGAPVRRVNDQPLLVYEPPVGGKFCYDTGPLVVEGDLSKDPRINLHHGTYEMDTIATIAGFHVTYEDAQGVMHRVDFTKPRSYDVRYDAPKRDGAELVIRAVDGQITAAFTVIGYRGGVRVSANVANLGDGEIRRVSAGFELRGCEKYYRSPLNRLSQFGDVAIVWSEQPRLELCNFVRLAGPAARAPSLERKGENIARAGFSAEVADHLAKGSGGCLELANVQAASRSFAERIEIYKDIDFEDADISMSFVNTYALLGLATYSYRFPEDKEAREVVDLMIGNFVGARERLRNRELGYLMWVLSLMGRDADANVVADLVEKRAATEKYTPLDMAGMAIGLRRVGRWEAADRVCANLDKAWDGVAAPADFLGMGAGTPSPMVERANATPSPLGERGRASDLAARCLSQLSAGLRSMVWDAPDRLTFHSSALVEEAASEAQSYMLVAFDLMSRMHGGVVPVRLSLEPATEITRISYDGKSGTCAFGVIKAGEMDIFTHYRPPSKVLWNGKPLDQRRWWYDGKAGVIRLTGLSGDGELAVSVMGAPPKDRWVPIDYIGLGHGPL